MLKDWIIKGLIKCLSINMLLLISLNLNATNELKQMNEELINILPDIIENPQNYIYKNDNYVIDLISIISNAAKTNSDSRYFDALESICKISDGYVSEEIMNTIGKQFWYNFSPLIEYLYNKKESCLESFLINSLSMEASYGEDSEREIYEYVQMKINESEYDDFIVKYIILLVKRIDPHKFD